MPRPVRIFVEGGFYHVYNRLGRGERVFDQEKDFIVRGAQVLEVEVDVLRSRRQDLRFSRARELLMILGVERYHLKLKYLAKELNNSPDGMTKTVAIGANTRIEDDEFRMDLNELDRALADSEV